MTTRHTVIMAHELRPSDVYDQITDANADVLFSYISIHENGVAPYTPEQIQLMNGILANPQFQDDPARRAAIMEQVISQVIENEPYQPQQQVECKFEEFANDPNYVTVSGRADYLSRSKQRCREVKLIAGGCRPKAAALQAFCYYAMDVYTTQNFKKWEIIVDDITNKRYHKFWIMKLRPNTLAKSIKKIKRMMNH